MPNYPEDQYDNVHESIADELRPELLTWNERLAEQTESDKKELCRKNIKRLERIANK